MSFEQELAKLNAELKRDPNNQSAKEAKSLLFNNRSIELTNQNTFQEAFELLEEAIQLTPNNVMLYVNKADYLNRLGKLNESAECAEKALKLDPNNYKAKSLLSSNLNNLYTICMDEGKHQEALDKINKALELTPNDFVALYNKAANLFKLGQPEEAIEFADKSHKANATFGNPLTLKAIILNHLSLKDNEKGNNDGALKKVNQAIELRPNEIAFRINKTSYLIETKKIKEAKDELQNVLELDPNNKDALRLKEVIAKKTCQYHVEEPYLSFVMHSHIPHQASSVIVTHSNNYNRHNHN